MRIGVRLAVSGLVLLSIIVSALGVHILWWRTAEATSQTLAKTINEQIVSAVGKELFAITIEAKSAFIAARALFMRHVLEADDPNKREFVLLAQLQAQPSLSWVTFGRPDGEFTAARKLGDRAAELIQIPAGPGTVEQKIEYYEINRGDFEFESRRTEPTSFKVTEQDWFKDSIESQGSQWFSISNLPVGQRLAVTLAGPIDVDGKRQGVVGIVVELTRVSRALSDLTVGKSGAVFILDRNGGIIAAPDPDADEATPVKTNQPLLPVAVGALKQSAGVYVPEKAEAFRTRFEKDDEAYEVNLTPLAFPGWSLVTVIPEAEFLGPVSATIRQLLIVVAFLIVGAGLLSVWLARRLIAAPLIKVVNEIKHVERFELDQVQRHASRLDEIHNLSGAIADMATGLSAFRKYIPADLVRRLLSERTEAKLGGTVRPMTILFADVAGFTGLSERLGDRIIPLLSRYFGAVSAEVQAHGGTIDKFIGDAVMAFWGAPAANPDHALACCRAALAIQRAIRASDIRDDAGEPLRVRIGINSGDILVGNIGSEVRLNYTVIGDAVNVASRLEGANKQYGTQIMIGEETRRLAGTRIYVRELDRLAVYGRSAGATVYELLGIAGEADDPASWVGRYEAGLAAYRLRDFSAAISRFEEANALRAGGDPPSRIMIARVQQAIAAPPDADWDATTVAETK